MDLKLHSKGIYIKCMYQKSRLKRKIFEHWVEEKVKGKNLKI